MYPRRDHSLFTLKSSNLRLTSDWYESLKPQGTRVHGTQDENLGWQGLSPAQHQARARAGLAHGPHTLSLGILNINVLGPDHVVPRHLASALGPCQAELQHVVGVLGLARPGWLGPVYILTWHDQRRTACF